MTDQPSKSLPSKTTKRLKLAAILYAVIFVAWGVGYALQQAYSPERLEREVRKGVDEINRRAPIVIDPATKITGASAHGLDVVYNVDVTMPIPEGQGAEFVRQVTPLARKVICEGSGTRDFVNHGATFTFRFQLMSGDSERVRIDNCTRAASEREATP